MSLLVDTYKASNNLWQKLVWWHDNLWSDEGTWVYGSYMLLTEMEGMQRRDALLPDVDREDWILCITHLAHLVRGLVSELMAICSGRTHSDDTAGYQLLLNLRILSVYSCGNAGTVDTASSTISPYERPTTDATLGLAVLWRLA